MICKLIFFSEYLIGLKKYDRKGYSINGHIYRRQIQTLEIINTDPRNEDPLIKIIVNDSSQEMLQEIAYVVASS